VRGMATEARPPLLPFNNLFVPSIPLSPSTSPPFSSTYGPQLTEQRGLSTSILNRKQLTVFLIQRAAALQKLQMLKSMGTIWPLTTLAPILIIGLSETFPAGSSQSDKSLLTIF